MEELFYELFEGMPRLGPGTSDATLKALNYIDTSEPMKVLDIGCGTGAQTFVLAKNIEGTIIALDNYQPYLDHIEAKAKKEDLKARIRCHCMDMKNIVCKHESLDLVWGEGSIYIMGFEKGLEKIRPLLKENGIVVLSDMNYLKEGTPEELDNFLKTECPDIISIEENIDLINRSGFKLIDHFELERKGHWHNYYAPLEENTFQFAHKYEGNQDADTLVESIQEEIDLYKKYPDYYGYVFYIMQKTG